jgi:glycosyltransferase involved in cell wall biosynthesis
MKLYFDYSTMQRWVGNPTGIPRTVFCLAMAMRELNPAMEFVVVDDELGRFHSLKGAPGECVVGEAVNFAAGDILFSAGAGWAFACYNEQVRLARSCGVRVYQVFYDLIPALFPYFYKQGISFGDYFGTWCKEAFSLCDGGFAISECTKSDMILRFGLDKDRAEKIRVIRLGEDFGGAYDNSMIVNRFSDEGKFLLSVGTLEVRKNQACLLNAYRLLAKQHADHLPTLILAGMKGWLDGDIEFQVKNDRVLNRLVRVITDANDYELQWLYKDCEFSLFPALYEGWGLPVAESLKAGRPCICSNTSSMLEIAPELTVFASPHSAHEWADAIGELLFETNTLEKLTEKVRRQYVPTSWSSTANAIMNSISGGFKFQVDH